jgi:hypothetical protein
MNLSKLTWAAIFGFGYYLVLNLYLYLALAMKSAQTGLLANKVLQPLVYGLGTVITLPFVYFAYEYKISWLERFSLPLNAVFWGLVFLVVLLIMEWKRKGGSGETHT